MQGQAAIIGVGAIDFRGGFKNAGA
jgi:hypothetical protein